jgi:hypothetical protein
VARQASAQLAMYHLRACDSGTRRQTAVDRHACAAMPQSNRFRQCRQRTSSESAPLPPACEMMLGQLKTVLIMRDQSAATGDPSSNCSAAGTTVQPRRTPVKPAYLENEPVSIAHCTKTFEVLLLRAVKVLARV